MREVLKNKGYKITPARLAILNIFDKSKLPLRAEDVHKILSKGKRQKDINEATIYRTLSSFEERKILRKIDLRKDSAYFELPKTHHHHIVCVNCNDIEDFEIKKFEKVLRRIVENSSKFKSIKDHSLEIFGLCRMCSKN